MDSFYIKHIEDILSAKVKNVITVSGGDISRAFKIETEIGHYFLKTNSNANAYNMFKAEKLGLENIKGSQSVATPKVIACGILKQAAFLLMEYVEPKTPSEKDFKNFGEQLAKLHQCTSNSFGLNQDNFIGSLPQSNQQHKNWLDFYTYERLLPQLKLAQQKNLLSNYECPSNETIKSHLKPLLKNIKPSLLHGDLWYGNYLISNNGLPYLIDPAMYYGHSEVDIAMSKLFGGFGESFYKAYHSQFPQNQHTAARIEIYQLYYLLVHLNLFGSSYYGAVTSILAKHF
ncbi:fructosamine kinase family protein [Gelatiniphilus marinus]|uniref:Fructosamine kinase family protein n=1 Tax=Gelatiniphilus marinus TaxID=1759464 RepID=A0ABW5JQ46_9FLAO